jgi:hypothetical protein
MKSLVVYAMAALFTISVAFAQTSDAKKADNNVKKTECTSCTDCSGKCDGKCEGTCAEKCKDSKKDCKGSKTCSATSQKAPKAPKK